MRFSDLYFGMADSKNEAQQQRDRFVASFVNHHQVVDKISAREKFILLGPKGTGKSAVAWYLELTAQERGQLVKTRELSDLPLSDVSGIKTGATEGPGRTVTAWQLLLLCGLLDVMLSDNSSSVSRDPEALRVYEALRREGFMDPTLKRAVLTASKSTLKLPIPGLGEPYARESTASLNLLHILPYLEKYAIENTSDNSYLLILDGLDSIYLNDPKYLTTISALLQAAYLTNQSLRSGSSKAQVVLLVRNDVFSRLNLADADKMRSDFGIDLDWRIFTGQPHRSSLVKMVNKKASSLAAPRVESVDVVGTYFSKDVQLGGRRGAPTWVPTYKYLLDLTRHTPRDLLQLLSHIQEAVGDDPDGLDRDGRVRPEALRDGVVRYSTHYFSNAIRNELVGRDLGDERLPAAAVSALRDLPNRAFRLRDFSRQCLGGVGKEDLSTAERLLGWLFFAGAIGNVKPGQRESYLQFYHRRDESDVYLQGTMLVHPALVYAAGNPFS